MASHFNAAGEANGWMSKTAFTALMLAIGLGIPAFVIGVMSVLRHFPAEYLNVPNADYWRAPGNYEKACAFLLASAYWFGCAFLIWQILFSRLVVAANLVSPPRFDSAAAFLFTVPLLLAAFGSVAVIILRFLQRD